MTTSRTGPEVPPPGLHLLDRRNVHVDLDGRALAKRCDLARAWAQERGLRILGEHIADGPSANATTAALNACHRVGVPLLVWDTAVLLGGAEVRTWLIRRLAPWSLIEAQYDRRWILDQDDHEPRWVEADFGISRQGPEQMAANA